MVKYVLLRRSSLNDRSKLKGQNTAVKSGHCPFKYADKSLENICFHPLQNGLNKKI